MLIIKKTIAALIIFLIVPIVVVVANWHWQPESLDSSSQLLFWITESAGAPWGILSSIFLFFLFCILIPCRTKKNIIKLWLILTATILVGQAAKSTIKSYAAESRPFVIWMKHEFSVDDKYFYSLPRSDRQALIQQHVVSSSTIPAWLYEHWRSETGYAFPSGHTLFATTWAFLALVLLGFQRHRVIVTTIVAWAVLIEISRLLLGMHHPLDLVLGTFLAWMIALGCYFVAKKWCIIEPNAGRKYNIN